MKIVYCVDVHNKFAAVQDALKKIGTVDLLIIGGDITDRGTPDDAERAITGWRGAVPQLLAIAGNMDTPAIDDRLAKLGVALDGRGVVFGDLGVFGVSVWGKSAAGTPFSARIAAGFAAVKSCRIKIFCPHFPPRDTLCDLDRSGQHVGHPHVKDFIVREQPDLVLCGHVHAPRQDRVGKTLIVNPGPAASGHYAVVEIGQQVDVRVV